MNRIVKKRILAPEIVLFEVESPRIAVKRKAGQFIILRTHEEGERIPLTIADSSPERGTITIVAQAVGKTTIQLCGLNEGDYIPDIVGPLGQPTHIEKFGTVVPVGGGIGVAVALPIAQACKEAGNRVVSIIGARNSELLILEDEISAVSDEVIVTTDDGSRGMKGFVSQALKQQMDKEKIDIVFAIGPVPMMKATVETTRSVKIPTYASLNAIMVDGTGMCGCCRIDVGGETRFCCVDGPEFDGHKVDFDLLSARLSTYRTQENQALEHHKLNRI